MDSSTRSRRSPAMIPESAAITSTSAPACAASRQSWSGAGQKSVLHPRGRQLGLDVPAQRFRSVGVGGIDQHREPPFSGSEDPYRRLERPLRAVASVMEDQRAGDRAGPGPGDHDRTRGMLGHRAGRSAKPRPPARRRAADTDDQQVGPAGGAEDLGPDLAARDPKRVPDPRARPRPRWPALRRLPAPGCGRRARRP